MSFLTRYVLVCIVAAIILIVAGMLIEAAASEPQPVVKRGCWTVTDIAGHVMYFNEAPKVNTRTGVIEYMQGRYTGWIFPAHIEEDTVCVEQLTPTAGG